MLNYEWGVEHMKTNRTVSKEQVDINKEQKVEMNHEINEDHFYTKNAREKLLEEDQLSYEEEAFMEGYDEERYEDDKGDFVAFNKLEGTI